MRHVDISVEFSGTVSVQVPGHLPLADAKLLATKLALARILATTDNPDAPEDDAFADYANECSDRARTTAEDDWDRCKIQGVGGQWSTQ